MRSTSEAVVKAAFGIDLERRGTLVVEGAASEPILAPTHKLGFGAYQVR
jgi:hypothetical protein